MSNKPSPLKKAGSAIKVIKTFINSMKYNEVEYVNDNESDIDDLASSSGNIPFNRDYNTGSTSESNGGSNLVADIISETKKYYEHALFPISCNDRGFHKLNESCLIANDANEGD